MVPLGQYEDALHLFDIALGKEPGNGEILFEKGKTLVSLDRHDEAQEIFRLSFTQLSDNYEPAYLRAESLVVLGRYEEADMAFDAALSLTPITTISGSKKVKRLCRPVIMMPQLLRMIA